MLESALPWCTRFMDRERLARLEHEIEVALKELYPEPWLPGLTDLLVEWGWQTLHHSTGITAADYGTGRVLEAVSKIPDRRSGGRRSWAKATIFLFLRPLLARRPETPRHVEAYLPIPVGGDTSTREIAIEFLAEEWSDQYRDIGLTFYTPDELVNSTVLECLEDAMAVLAQVPTLQKTVATLVRTCHILKPEDDAYDVSHSDPLVPFSVCVSVPRKRRLDDALRVAEALAHEAMHLQLTLIERIQPLVCASSQTYFSPWKGTHRSPQGILHGLYVFRVLDSFFEKLLILPGWSVTSVAHMCARRYKIAQQFHDIKAFKDHPALTELGADLASLLISS